MLDKIDAEFGYLLEEPNLPVIATLFSPGLNHFVTNLAFVDQCMKEVAGWHEEWPLELSVPVRVDDDTQPSKRRVISERVQVDDVEKDLKHVRL